MERAIRITQPGPPSIMSLVEVDIASPGPGEALVRHQAIAVNYLDIQHRSGAYPMPMPAGLGMEGAGVVEKIGEGVQGLNVGDRVIYIAEAPGSYATARVRPACSLVKIPDPIDTDALASTFTRGLTAWHLTHTVKQLGSQDKVVVHTAAGGVGGLLVQFAARSGAYVVGIVRSDAEAQVAADRGCHHVLVSPGDHLPAEVRKAGNGMGATVVYDPVGRDTFRASLDCLDPLGLMVAFGNLSGPIPPFMPMAELGHRGSLQLVWPMLKDFLTPKLLPQAIDGLFDALTSGLKTARGEIFVLADAVKAHEAMEAGHRKGALLLRP